jgi:hypothetical protein
MYHVEALTKLTTGSDLPMAKAVLSDLYLRKGNKRQFPRPRAQDFKCTSRHHRYDRDPYYSYKHNIGKVHRGQRVRYIEADMAGQGLFRRYDGKRNKPWMHSKMDTVKRAGLVIRMAASGRRLVRERTFASPPDWFGFSPMHHYYRGFLEVNIKDMISRCKVDLRGCHHDSVVVYPIGQMHNQIFSPGFHQAWMTFSPDRKRFWIHLLVAGSGDDSAAAYFVGAESGWRNRGRMCFSFTSFSRGENPMDFRIWVRQDWTGLIRTEMIIFHYELIRATGRYHAYLNVFFDCYYQTVQRWRTWNRKAALATGQNDLQFDFFMDKALQIFSLCDCYEKGNRRNGCMMNKQSEMKGWDGTFGAIIQHTNNLVRATRKLWRLQPHVTYQGRRRRKKSCQSAGR